MKTLKGILIGVVLALGLSVYAAKQTINIGSTANDGTGDTLRTAGGKMNSNFTELYDALATVLSGTDTRVPYISGNKLATDAGLTYNAAMDALSTGTIIASSSIGAPDGSFSDDLLVGDDADIAGNLTADDGLTTLFEVDVYGSVSTEGDPGSEGQVLTSHGMGVAPSWETASSSGSFEVEFSDACTTTPSMTWDWVRVGKILTITWQDSVSCTSDSTGFGNSTAQIPAGLRPVAAMTFPLLQVMNNSVTEVGCVRITTGGAVSVIREDASNFNCTASQAWTASGGKGWTTTTGNVLRTITYAIP